MSSNYYIQTETGTPIIYFGGWDHFGEIITKENPDYIYRMQRTVAERNLYKVEEFLRRKCVVKKLKENLQ